MNMPKEIGQSLSAQEQRLFIAALQSGIMKNNAIRDVFYLQLETGMRPGEAVAIQWHDIDFESEMLIVRHTVRRTKGHNSELLLGPPKSRRERKIPLSENALWLLKERLSSIENVTEDALVFTNNRGGLIEPNSLNRYLKQCRLKMQEIATNETSIPIFTAHSLRHTFATRMLEQGIPQKVVAEWLGHSSTRITGDIYSHVSLKTSQVFRYKVGNVISFDELKLI